MYFCLVKAVSKRRYGGKIPEDILVLSFSMRKFRGVGINKTYVFLDKFQQTHVTHTFNQYSASHTTPCASLNTSFFGTLWSERSVPRQVIASSGIFFPKRRPLPSERSKAVGLGSRKNQQKPKRKIMTPTVSSCNCSSTS